MQIVKKLKTNGSFIFFSKLKKAQSNVFNFFPVQNIHRIFFCDVKKKRTIAKPLDNSFYMTPGRDFILFWGEGVKFQKIRSKFFLG